VHIRSQHNKNQTGPKEKARRKQNKKQTAKSLKRTQSSGAAANTFSLLTREEKNAVEMKNTTEKEKKRTDPDKQKRNKNATEKEKSPPDRKDTGAVVWNGVLITPPSVVVTSCWLDFESVGRRLCSLSYIYTPYLFTVKFITNILLEKIPTH
jgi:hypothetical protein